MAEKNEMFNIPRLAYFQYGNIFSGSWKGFDYKIIPVADGQLEVKTWTGPFCDQKSEIQLVQQFPASEEGLVALVEHLYTQYQAFYSANSVEEE